jgi:hypothetical protein
MREEPALPSAVSTEAPAETVQPVAPSRDAPRATLAQLRGKKRAQRELPFVLGGEEVSFLFKAISAKDYDQLQTDCPPTLAQRGAGTSYNINKFAPKLLSRVIAEPDLPEDVWEEFWTSPDWNRGELLTLFGSCVDICNTGLDLGPTAVV